MVKRVLFCIALVLLCAYVVMALTAFNRPPQLECGGVTLCLRDTMTRFVTQGEVRAMLRKQGVDPTGQPLMQVSTTAIEEVLRGHPLVDEAECYKTPSGTVCVELTQRVPILRVMPDGGSGYYLDNKGRVMPLSASIVAHLPVATGHISRDFACRELYGLAGFLQEDAFWKAQVEQIHVLPTGGVELVPRVGNHLIYLGTLSGYVRKLDRVRRFYTKVLGQVGWNKYSRINVEFSNQVICTRREDKN